MKLKTFSLITFLFIQVAAFAHFGIEWITEKYQAAMFAQSRNAYPQLLESWIRQPDFSETLVNSLATELERVRTLSNTDRKSTFTSVLYYFSKKHGRHKESAFQLVQRLSYSADDIMAGNYDSRKLAEDMVKGAAEYVRLTFEPILQSVVKEIHSSFPTQNLVFLGRDFTGAFAYYRSKYPADAHRTFTLNVSREVRDLSLAGQSEQMRAVFASIGLDATRAAQEGVVFFDSSMKGRIPRAILTAWAEVLTDERATELLLKSDLRYIRSKKLPGQTLPNYVRAFLSTNAVNGVLTRHSIQQILTTDLPIDRFEPVIPATHAAWDTEHIHNLFEHVPKFMMPANSFARQSDGSWVLQSTQPQSHSDVINSIIGLAADAAIYRAANGIKEFKPEAYQIGLPRNFLNDPTIAGRMKEIDKAFKTGYKGMKAWQDSDVLEGTEEALARVELVETGDTRFPWVIHQDGKTVLRLTQFLGEGRNIKAYLTEHGTVFKLLKAAKNARKLFLQAWAGPVIESYGIKIAKVLDIHPSGIWMVQEAVPGESLEMKYGWTLKGLPPKIERQVLDYWDGAKRLANEKDIWLDLKAANCHVDVDGDVIFVDFAPRLNKGYRRYFEDDQQQPLSKSGFLNEFLYRQIRDQKTFVSPQGVDCEAILKKLNEGQGET